MAAKKPKAIQAPPELPELEKQILVAEARVRLADAQARHAEFHLRRVQAMKLVSDIQGAGKG
jgi:hypothetical protein